MSSITVSNRQVINDVFLVLVLQCDTLQITSFDLSVREHQLIITVGL